MTVKINLKRAERKVLPEADYLLNIVKAEQREGKASKEPTLHLELLPDEETHPEYSSVRLYQDMSLQEQSWFRVVELCQAALGNLEEDKDGDFEFEAEQLIGSQIAAQVIVDDTYDGTPRNKLNSVYSPSDFELGEESGEEPAEEEGEAS